MFKQLLQILVVKTSFWPFTRFYNIYYQGALGIIVWVLKRQKGVEAIYLSAGLATGNYVYGLSDIDLIVVIKKEDKTAIEQVYRRLSRLIPILKYGERGLYTFEEIINGYKKDIFLKYNFNDCLGTGRLLYGEDILGKLDKLDAKGQDQAVVGKAAFIWSTLIKQLLAESPKAGIVQDYLCYKLCADSCKAFILAQDNLVVSDRAQALSQALCAWGPDSRQDHREHIIQLQGLSRSRFRLQEKQLRRNTYSFCFDLLNKTAGQINQRMRLDNARLLNPQADFVCTPEGPLLSEQNKQSICSFIELVNKRYKNHIGSILICPSSLVGIDEQNACLFITEKARIPLEMINDFNTIIGLRDSPQRLSLYILTPEAAFSLTRVDFTQLRIGFYTPGVTPLNFLFLGSAAAVLFGEPLKCSNSEIALRSWFCQEFSESIQEDKQRIAACINDPNIVRVSNIQFHLLFWQALQLKLIEDNFALGKNIIPLSSRQVCRLWNQLQDYKISWLKEFYDQYNQDLNVSRSDSGAFFPQAILALKEIYRLP